MGNFILVTIRVEVIAQTGNQWKLYFYNFKLFLYYDTYYNNAGKEVPVTLL